MLDKTSIHLLNYMIKYQNTTSYVWMFDTSLDILSAELNVKDEDLRACIRYLESKGFLEYQYASSGTTKYIIGFHLSHQGLHYVEITGIERKQFFYRSILTPIIVTITTTLVLHLLGVLL